MAGRATSLLGEIGQVLIFFQTNSRNLNHVTSRYVHSPRGIGCGSAEEAEVTAVLVRRGL